jgi:hypothetical protein
VNAKGFSKERWSTHRTDLMNLKTPYDVLCLTFHASWTSRKDDGKDYSFDSFCGLLIRAQEKLLDEGKLEVKQQAHLLKGKG